MASSVSPLQTSSTMAGSKSNEPSPDILEWETEKYVYQKQNLWPPSGKHILAQYNEDAVVVYQAFCPAIAEYAVTNQR